LVAVVPGNIGLVRDRWLSRRAILLHIGFVLFVPACALAAWWQITRAEDGNGLSYLYSVEWPIFALLSAYFWWMLIHTDYDDVGLRGMRNRERAGQHGLGTALVSPAAPATTPAEPISPMTVQPPHETDEDATDPELAAYNARLAELGSNGPKTWRNPETLVARRQR
jgi:hypothetical protein